MIRMSTDKLRGRSHHNHKYFTVFRQRGQVISGRLWKNSIAISKRIFTAGYGTMLKTSWAFDTLLDEMRNIRIDIHSRLLNAGTRKESCENECFCNDIHPMDEYKMLLTYNICIEAYQIHRVRCYDIHPMDEYKMLLTYNLCIEACQFNQVTHVPWLRRMPVEFVEFWYSFIVFCVSRLF